MLTISQHVRLIDDSGQGTTLVFLRDAAAVSKTVEVLQNEFRVLSFAVDAAAHIKDVVNVVAHTLETLKLGETAVVADRAAALAAIELAVAKPELVQSVALLSPECNVGDASHLKAPVLAMFGTPDAARAADAPKTFCRSIPNCRLVYVYDAGRAVDDERPEAVAAALRDFALRREGYLVNAKQGKLYP